MDKIRRKKTWIIESFSRSVPEVTDSNGTIRTRSRFRAWCGGSLVVLILGFLAPNLFAQTSSNYQNTEHVFNSGGNPANGSVLTSTNFTISLSSIGESPSATGMNSSGYHMDGGFVPPYPPPGEVLNLLFATKTSFSWNPETSVGTYDVYRGVISGLPASYGTCLEAGLTLPRTSDVTIPAAGQCYFYVITAENRLAEEGTMGWNSGGTSRPNSAPCP